MTFVGIEISLVIFGFLVGYLLMIQARRITALERRLAKAEREPVYQGPGRTLDLDRLLIEHGERLKKEIASKFGSYQRRYDQLRG